VPLREVWEHEAANFTVWLRDNIDLLNDVVGFSLSGAEREQPAGKFSVDLVAENEAGDPVAIENQLEPSDHDHLGKLITYLSAIEAPAAIWIVSDPRPEHIKAVAWLNEAGLADFFMVKVEAVRIDNSPAAPLFTLIVGPSRESRQVGERKKEIAERHELRYDFWTGLLQLARTKTKLHDTRSPSTDNWISAAAGARGLSFDYVIRQRDCQVDLYIDRGPGADQENKRIFDSLLSHKEDIEDSFGAPLEWQPLETRRGCRIASRIDLGGYRDEDRWPEIQTAMVDAMIRLEAALRPFFPSLPTGE